MSRITPDEAFDILDRAKDGQNILMNGFDEKNVAILKNKGFLTSKNKLTKAGSEALSIVRKLCG